ncbi:hypothetical protein [Aestuariirhabdus litorea]|uniref:DUF1877 family protein n=1 Tax=Aestuariirhabdus litorea TaxID=2528527 RepID=A0A3P3VN79_9GAMM|nr:hypothetical protein [Aestuariirhabdus litorea]RRJ84211.1 hypothetical protein D0544_03610 [Aestuariirhabdus litorea]RWW97433.1 hypothetical protein DZC74_03610 [Endozoicomonadaceae bacterium GTF-13]
MDVRTRYLVASPTEIDDIVENPHQPERWPGFACLDLDLEKLVDLLALCREEALSEALIRAFEVHHQASVQGPWLIELPADLCGALQALDEAERQALADRWSRSESFAGAPWREADLAMAITHLGALAKIASERGAVLMLHQGVEGDPVVIG